MRLDSANDYEEGQEVWFESYEPKIIHPAPPIIKIPQAMGAEAKAELLASFSLFWVDDSACVARSRSALERIMDDAKIPRRARTKNGKYTKLPLHGRIEKFGKRHSDLGEFAMALN
jgi:hypothetical protein